MFTSDAAYDSFMGRFSTRLAPVFADFAGIVPGDRVLDVGAGTGALTAELAARGADAAAVDPSPAFVAALESRFPEAEVRAGGAEAIPWPDGEFDAALAQLVISFMSDAPAGIREMARVVRPGGTVAVCMWDREGMEMLAAIDRTREALGDVAEGRAKYRTRPEIESLFERPEMELLEVEASYVDFEDFWTALTGGAGPAGVWASSLDADMRASARTELYRQLDEPDGPFTLVGRAWAARVRRA
jgi:ubiquinone/menaquinone biosynthesis C-methylase UbiE